MTNRNIKLFFVLACMTLGLTACKQDYFDQERYDQLVKDAFPVDNIDPNHTWKLFGTATVNVSMTASTGESYRLAVYKEDPNTSTKLTLLSRGTVKADKSTALQFSFELASPTVYVCIYDKDNRRATRKLNVSDNATLSVRFSDGTASARVTRANSGNDVYPATHEYTDANGNVIAGANMNHNEWADPDKEFGGWVVPDALTEGQKLRVRKYFQANPNLGYVDPHFRHFFVQQVYTGGTSAPETGNKEATVSADGQAHKGMTLNQLTVGEACSHINDFNAGTCTASQVLDNGSSVNNATYHSDQITLMVNVYDTSCFGYHETSGSNVNPNNNHNDKMALVSAAAIDAWAAANGNPGEAVVDEWNRSFMGFDYELLPESDIVENSYALLSQVPNINNILYAWDGEKVMTIGEAPEAPQATPRQEVDITATFAQNPSNNNTSCTYDESGNIVCTFNNQYYNNITFYQAGDWSSYDKLMIEFAEPSPVALTLGCNGEAAIAVGATSVEVPVVNYAYNGGGGPSIYGGTGSTEPVTLKIKKVTLVKEATTPVVDTSIVYYNPTYLLGDNDADKVAFYSRNTNMYGGIVRNVTEDEMKTTQDGKTCLDLTFFQGLVANGYHPITTDLKTWVKWQAACDGYYSDWIVTLTEAERIDQGLNEDGSDDEENTTLQGFRFCFEDNFPTPGDFDFNDVVITVSPVVDGNVVTMTVTLNAVGATKTIGAAMRFVDVQDSWVQSMSCTRDFDAGANNLREMVESESVGNNVFRCPSDIGFTVRLFNDAHWALSRREQASGEVEHYMLNTIKGDAAHTYDEQTVTFTFELDTEEHANLFTLEDHIDVFIVEYHNSIAFEVHTVPFKLDQVIKQYANDAKMVPYAQETANYPWAICTPASFRYPREWQSICGSKLQGLTSEFGYEEGQEPYPFFADWATDHEKHTHWYEEEVNGSLVY